MEPLGQEWDIGVLSIWLAHEALRRGEMVRIKERARAGPGPACLWRYRQGGVTDEAGCPLTSNQV